MEDAAALVTTVARNVRALREGAGLSLGQLASAAGIGKSTLSLLESGSGNPSVETLWSIARSLGVPFGRLIEAPVPDVRVVRAGEGIQVGSESAPYRARLLAASARRGSTELYVLEIEPGPARQAEPHIAGVVEHVLVLQGTLLAGPAQVPATLEPGDLASFGGDAPHRYEALAAGTRALLWMDYA